MVKRYIAIKNTMKCKLPHWFYNDPGKKWISIVSFTFVDYENSGTIKSYEDIELRWDLPLKDDSLNGYLCNSGNTIHKRPKWEIPLDNNEINFNMCLMNGEPLEFDESTHTFTGEDFQHCYFIIQLLIETKD